MTSTQHGVSNPFPRAQVDFDDAELDRYLEDNRRPGGETIVDVDDWENLSKDQQDRFIQRLRVRAQNASAAVKSRPLNLDHVNTQLLRLSSENTSLPQSGGPRSRHERASTEPLPGIEFYQEQERVLYEELINAGGRPWYPISLLKYVSENPDQNRAMLSFWAPAEGDWAIFEKQLGRWQNFCIWQQDHRGVDDEEGEIAADIERRRQLLTRMGETWSASRLEGEENIARERAFLKENREYRRYMIREEDAGDRFCRYVKAVKERLARHGFTRAFKLEQDPTRQDKLTTWIEYLYYEYWWYDQYMADVKRLQSRYDRAWKELVDSVELRPFETEEYILNNAFEHGFLQHSEESAARKAVTSAKSAAMSAFMKSEKARKNPKDSKAASQARMRMLAAAHSRLAKANKAFKEIEARNDCFTDFHQTTRSYKIKKKNADKHRILLRWILEQLPLVEAELNESKSAGGMSADPCNRKRRFRCDQDNATLKGQNLGSRSGKRRQKDSPLNQTTSHAQTKKRSLHDDTVNKESSLKRTKISGPGLKVLHRVMAGATDAISITRARRSFQTSITNNGGESPSLEALEGLDVKISNISNSHPLQFIGVSQASESPPRSRRSPRIAALQNKPKSMATPCTVKDDKSQEKVRQTSKPSLSTALQDQQSTPSARKRTRIKAAGQFGMSKQNGMSKRGRRRKQSSN